MNKKYLTEELQKSLKETQNKLHSSEAEILEKLNLIKNM